MITGIIAEYNPFHNGHLYQINKVRELYGHDTGIVACISGGLTQRGETPILDKWQRAALAVENGVNLVLELPAIFAGRSAQHFAFGGVSLLHKLGVVDRLVFSTEYPDIEQLSKAASIDIDLYRAELQFMMKQGQSYASALPQVMSRITGIDVDIFKEPNTILGIEYIKALKHLSSSMEPVAIQRIGTSHTDTEIANGFASGTAIRELMTNAAETDTSAGISQEIRERLQSVVPEATYNKLISLSPSDFNRLYPTLQLKLLNSRPKELAEIYSMNEGMEYKLMEAATAPTMTEFVDSLLSKRYQRSRINRLVNYILLDLTKDLVAEAERTGVTYGRVLAFDDRGREIMKEIKKVSALPLVTKVSQYINQRDFINKYLTTPLQRQLHVDIQYNNLYELGQQKPQLNKDFVTSPFYYSR
ncbi:UPF0348 protein family [Anaerovibrio sp. JC8]|uniref:tRNA(Met) cytidine acetate ligase n=1 Tax=Anaerovibrio sp. JC8 TaxID=1240085 RepID=UPI000A09DF09|nr:nucleotidyltransferase family protein [Anaerovibrio sp. JC8]ORU00756.1 UPF0348 protein family [Anaerovibrio sp. JC8]